MKKIVFATMAALLISMTATAQENQEQIKREKRKFDKTEMVRHRTDATVKKYGLNATQAQQLLDLNTRYADKMKPGMGGPRPHHGMRGQRPPKANGNQQPPKEVKGQRPEGGQRPELTAEQKEKMAAHRKQVESNIKAYEAELEKIMTPEQFQAYKTDMQKNRHHKPVKRHGKKTVEKE